MATETIQAMTAPAQQVRPVRKAPIDTSDFCGSVSPLFLPENKDVRYNDWRDDLVHDGVAVIKGAIPRDRADGYAESMYSFLENFGLGFKRDDPSTVKNEHLPAINEKGMCFGYGINHEQFAWDIRQEPGVIDTFRKVYDTEELVVSFDGVNFGFPNRKDVKENVPWPHQDQDREKPGFRCLQGLVNLLPNGPNDGGLIVCKGAYLLSEEFHEEFENETDSIWAWTKEWYGFTDSGMKWLEKRGFTWEKVCAEPGDLIVWDSRTPHYNLTPAGSSPRFCTYVCMMPVRDVSQDDLIKKKAAFEEYRGTTHWPNALQVIDLPVLRDGKPDPYNYKTPKSGPPKLTGDGFKLTGIPYVKASA